MSTHPETSPLPRTIRAALRLYQLAWVLAIPLLRRNTRLQQGLSQRLLHEMPPPADLWIQAASVGEAQLAREILLHLQPLIPLRILLTTYTSQGREILEKLKEEVGQKTPTVTIETAFFPFDHPGLMERAVTAIAPRLLLLLESELWPGLLHRCRQRGVAVLVANGRMSAKSLRHYLLWPGLWQALRPRQILAMSSEDATRFATLFGSEGVETVPNIKFDRIGELPPATDNPLANLFPPEDSTALIVLGSIRQEEEEDVLRMIDTLQMAAPQAIIALFPRHMHRIEPWGTRLANRPWRLRSELTGPVEAGSIVLWDTMGEMLPAFRLARAAFIGGSLAPVGGQNFLEPLQCGLRPVIGPHWSNFYWIGREIFTQGLVCQAKDWQEAARLLVEHTAQQPQREQTREEVMDYVASRRGGTRLTCAAINNLLHENIQLQPIP